MSATTPRSTLGLRRLMLLLALAALSVLVPIGGQARAAPGDVVVVAGQPRADCLDNEAPPATPGSSATAARFDYRLRGIAVDVLGGSLFLAESRDKLVAGVSHNDSRIWRVDLASGRLDLAAGGGTQLGDGPAAQADIQPVADAVAVRDPGRLYFLDLQQGGAALALRSLQNGSITTVATLSPAVDATAVDLTTDAAGAFYYSNTSQGVTRIKDGSITSVPTGGLRPTAVAVDAAGSTLYMVEQGSGGTNHDGRLAAVDLLGGGSVRILRRDLAYPGAVAVDLLGRLFVAQKGTDAHNVVELDPASGATLQTVAAAQLAGPTGMAVVSRPPDPGVDVYVQDGDRCAIYKVDHLAPAAPPTTQTTAGTNTTIGGTDKKTDNPTPPTIPTGQTGTQTQTGTGTQTGTQTGNQTGIQTQPGAGTETQTAAPNQTQILTPAQSGAPAQTGVQPGVQPQAGVQPLSQLGASNAASPAPQIDPSAGANLAGSAPGSSGAQSGLVGPSAAPAAPPAAPPPAPAAPPPAPAAAPPAPAAPPAAGPVPGAHSAPAPGQPAVAAPEGQVPRGATRYAMVAHRSPAPGYALAALGLFGFLSCGVALAFRLEPSSPHPASPAGATRRCKPKVAC